MDGLFFQRRSGMLHRMSRNRGLENMPERTSHTCHAAPTAVDLFSGCGAVSEGLKQAGFRVLAAVDSNPVAGKTYRRNHPDVRFHEADITVLDPERLRIPEESVDLLVVCAPCQPFSNQNRYKNPEQKERLLILEAVRFAERLRPKIIFFENVPGLAGETNGAILKTLRKGLEQAGYACGGTHKIDAADFNVPQRRIRCVMFASRLGELPPFPPEGTGARRRTVRDAIGDLPPLRAGETTSDALHFARRHLPQALERLRHIPKNGGSRFALPPSLELRCHKGRKGYPDVYGRMRWEDVAPTLTTGCTDVTRGRFAHPVDDRAISLREAARLQTFPDDYAFCGNASDIAMQIGNAVPVELARAVGRTVREALARGAGAPAPA